ncbi:MAG: T9SS type A sorting domain-containing protein [Bacteroidales bacterium]|nr:T9SS type A sorting domain-containing protein [Bacteroidales bacterium]
MIELVELNNNNKKNQLHISSVIHGYRDIFAIPNNYGDSYSCNIDIACSQGNDWRVEGNAVAMLILANGTRLCSGSLINNTANDFKSYLLTAFHCLDIGATNCSLTDAEKSAPNNWLFRLHYESPTCGGVEGTDYITINGASFRAAYQPTDFALLEFMTTPIFATYSGWQRSSSAASSEVGIHHPVGDVKKISFDNHTLTSYASQINWSDGCTTPANTHWQVGFDEGTAEGGSSGSPILNPNHRIVGQLHGGYSGCPPVTKYYGRFDKSWTGGGTNTTRLSNWIDPTSSGVTYLNTKYSISSTISGSFVICLGYSSSYTVNNVPSNSTIFWENSSNITRISAQSSNPCTFSSTANGSGWIRVKIRNNTDNSFVTLPQYPIWIGKFDATVVTGQAAVCPDELYTYTAQVPGGHSSSYNYEWTYPDNWIWQAEMENWIRLKTPMYNPQYGTVRVEITNVCGTAGPSGITVYPGYCGGYYRVFPNPADDYVEISIDESKLAENKIDDYEVRIYNSMNIMVSQIRTRKPTLRINTRQFINGIYTVHFITGDKLQVEQLVISH